MPKKFTLTKNERLKSRKEIDLVFKEGKSFTVFPFKVYYRQSVPKAFGSSQQLIQQGSKGIIEHLELGAQNPPKGVLRTKQQVPKLRTCLQFGIGISSKLFRKAVDRNQIKRLTREAYRLQKLELQEKIANLNCRLFVFFIYTTKELADFRIIWEKTGLILKRLCKLADDKSFLKS